MKIYYVDTSALIKRYHRETGTNRINEIIEEIKAGKSKGMISYLGVLESISAITRRKGEIGNRYLKVIKGMLGEIEENFTIHPIDNEVMALSMRIILRHGLRTLDSIHLAAAIIMKEYMNKKIIFVSSDRELLQAAEKEDFEILNPEE